VRQLHLDQVTEARDGLLKVTAGCAEPAELQAAGGEAVRLADDRGLVVQHPLRLVCCCDHPALLWSSGGALRALRLRE
jgi:hypothetical protein